MRQRGRDAQEVPAGHRAEGCWVPSFSVLSVTVGQERVPEPCDEEEEEEVAACTLEGGQEENRAGGRDQVYTGDPSGGHGGEGCWGHPEVGGCSLQVSRDCACSWTSGHSGPGRGCRWSREAEPGGSFTTGQGRAGMRSLPPRTTPPFSCRGGWLVPSPHPRPGCVRAVSVLVTR